MPPMKRVAIPFVIAAGWIAIVTACSSSSSSGTSSSSSSSSGASSGASGSSSSSGSSGTSSSSGSSGASSSSSSGSSGTSTSSSSGSSGSTDGGGDGNPEQTHCGQPGDTGNSLGVGKYCTGIQDCFGNSKATLCSTLGGPGTNFCTFMCTQSDASTECGENASCQCQGGQCGCLPNICL